MNKENVIDVMKYMINVHEKAEGCANCELRDLHRLMRETPVSMWGKILNENKRWRANARGFYWCVTDGYMVTQSIDDATDCDNYRYDSHNYFRTKEEAEKYARVLETEMLLKKFADEHNSEPIDWNDADKEKFYLIYASTTNRLLIPSTYDGHEARAIYFNSKEIAQDAINEIGKDRIIDYLAYEW